MVDSWHDSGCSAHIELKRTSIYIPVAIIWARTTDILKVHLKQRALLAPFSVCSFLMTSNIKKSFYGHILEMTPLREDYSFMNNKNDLFPLLDRAKFKKILTKFQVEIYEIRKKRQVGFDERGRFHVNFLKVNYVVLA